MTVVSLCLLLQAQLDRIVIPAGTPEDQALQAISNEQDAQKKLALYEDFLQKFSSNPAAVAYGNWQISQHYQSTGDLHKALDYGDKALASSPHNLDILVSQASIAQQVKNNGKLMGYSVRGGGRFRVNVYRQRGTVAVVMRAIPMTIPAAKVLLPPRSPPWWSYTPNRLACPISIQSP